MQLPSFFNGIGEVAGDAYDGVKESLDSGLLSTTDKGLFNSKTLGSTLQGGGQILSALGSFWGLHKQEQYQDEMFDMEKERIDKETKKQDKFDKGMSNSFS